LPIGIYISPIFCKKRTPTKQQFYRKKEKTVFQETLLFIANEVFELTK
jgi:hypothetical protein